MKGKICLQCNRFIDKDFSWVDEKCITGTYKNGLCVMLQNRQSETSDTLLESLISRAVPFGGYNEQYIVLTYERIFEYYHTSYEAFDDVWIVKLLGVPALIEYPDGKLESRGLFIPYKTGSGSLISALRTTHKYLDRLIDQYGSIRAIKEMVAADGESSSKPVEETDSP